jgi:hypothetical protein
MTIEYWTIVKEIFLIMCYVGIASNIINLFLKGLIERDRRPFGPRIGPWIGGTIITSVIGSVLFGISFSLFGSLAADTAKQQLYYQLALFVGVLLPLWLDPILTIKNIIDQKSYGRPKNMGPVIASLVVLALVFVLLLFLTR